MKLMGFLLMPAGWVIVLAALVLLSARPSRAIFTLAGIAIEVLGLIIAVHSHARLPLDEK
jgi:hypothetical protein